MRDEEYRRLDLLEDRMWWFAGLHGVVLGLVARHAPGPAFSLLDAGCGTGGMLQAIGARFPQARLHGVDYAERACALARAKARAEIRCGSVNDLPYEDGAFDVVVSLDVLDADDVDPPRAVTEFGRVLRPGGLLVLNLAAYQWLLSYHDRAVGQSRRFDLRQVDALLGPAGLRRVQGTYWNTFLFPFMVLRRKVWPAGEGGSDVRGFPGPLDALCRRLVALEGRIIAGGGRLPFGGSVAAAARKEG